MAMLCRTAAFLPTFLVRETSPMHEAICANALSWILSGWSNTIHANRSMAASTFAVAEGRGVGNSTVVPPWMKI